MYVDQKRKNHALNPQSAAQIQILFSKVKVMITKNKGNRDLEICADKIKIRRIWVDNFM